MADKKRAPRKTNDELTQNIFKAAINILENDGYESVTFNNIAHTANTGRPVLYRRWNTPFELLLDAEDYFDDTEIDTFADIDFTGKSLRENLITSLAHFDSSRQFLRAVLIELGNDNPVVHNYFNDLHRQQLYIMERIISQAQLDGELKHTVTDTVKLLPFNLLLYQAMVDQKDVSVDFVTTLVDEAIIPAIMAQQ
ncbi:TetR/AcrR family transcriptional regulator [Pediococcus argentinicus]|uniref:HTH tetR-type domain-containing protein n=1 Tax=Pediococcus argentinicus TaxID=480391 RepID=A0A0R2NP26_9LACO|nr:TetR/AcrR family transcriptional regulator [Pediococcus argentinicus]KRO24906.1 hypothetical protein IV88_GL000570 [Pediococcus argentinicus]NKZ22605.1 TetR/AcrR family transcriptional regulator [Pediococcus argentinicus]GEP19736.1 TetR family transcriptional regulator [Pediococcus argentinicus]